VASHQQHWASTASEIVVPPGSIVSDASIAKLLQIRTESKDLGCLGCATTSWAVRTKNGAGALLRAMRDTERH
jgi:hypothetical protein